MTVTRKQICQAFKDAVPRLARNEEDIAWYSCSRGSNKEEFICLAISPNSLETQAMRAARNIIDNRIDCFGSVRYWLLDKGIPKKDITTNNVQEYRHRWLQSLIKEFSS
jgi:hypothetical protein